MNKKLHNIVAVTASLLVFALSACGSTAATSSASATASIPTIKSGVLQVAIASADPPSSYIKNDKPAGYNVDIIKKIADGLKLKIEWKTADYSVHIPNIANGTWDTSTQGALVTPERKKQVAFSEPVDYAQAVLVSLKSHKFDTLKAAKGKKIGIYTDAHEAIAEKDISGVQIVKFQDQAGALNALRIGQIDGYINGQNSALTQASDNSDIALSDPVSSGQVSIPLPKNNKKLVNAFNKQLDKLAADGTLYKLHKKYYPTVAVPQDFENAYDTFKTE
jgi:ABC-type amino acid transport substrate-binding protein